ncbi:MAG: thiolase family protein [Pseudomonadota bacterium]
MTSVYIIGTGMTAFGRFLERSLTQLTEEAVNLALRDAALTPDEIGAIAFANATQGAMEGQFGIRGQVALAGMPFDAVPIVNVENACASASTALQVAMMQVQTGQTDIALAIGAEKMCHPDSSLSMAAFQGSWDRANTDNTVGRLDAMAAAVPTPADEAARESTRTVFMDIYAAFAKYHMGRFGTTQRQIAAVAAKNHQHSVENPLSQYRKSFTTDEVLESRLIAWPFTLPMCSSISDGAAAAVVCNEAAMQRLGASARAVKVRGFTLMNGGRREHDDIERHIARRAARKCYELAGVGPEDIDVVECHDATAFGEIQQSENLGFFPFGEGGPAAERGDTRIGGRIPFNPSGGLESKGHPIGATGLGQIHELVTQLRGEAGPRQVEGARLALQENGGGLIGIEEAAVVVSILEACG